jgi:hypothetical protein
MVESAWKPNIFPIRPTGMTTLPALQSLAFHGGGGPSISFRWIRLFSRKQRQDKQEVFVVPWTLQAA